jgi:hypothetical protein
MQEQETAVGLGLKEMLAEAVAGISCMIGEHETNTDDMASSKAALSYFERLAALEVQVQAQGYPVEPRFFAEVWKTTQPTAYGASLLHVWQPEDHDQAEVEAVAHLAAAIECRRRNGEGV